MGSIRIGLLGPMDVMIGGVARPLPGLRRRTILAVLGLSAGSPVSVDRLVDIVWGGKPPATLVNSIQSHISYLRRVLGERSAIVTRASGYVLDLPPSAVDAVYAQQLIRDALHPGDDAGNAARLRTALDLWRGQPLSDVADAPWVREQGEHLENLRMQAIVSLSDARLALGQHSQLVPELENLAAEHPLREHIHAQLMLALYRSGRQADALAVYQRMRHTIADDLGIDPSPELRELESAVLRQDPSLDAPPPDRVTLAQLPLTPSTFCGRTEELRRLDKILDAVGANEHSATIVAVWGTAGVGKTALAVQWAHRIATRFPDGQLYANLRGFDPTGSIAAPAEVLRGLLDALGVPPAQVPSTVEAQAGLYRSLLADKRVLVVLDDARDETQVRPLLPAAPFALVVVTSRTRLTGLVAIEGAQAVEVDLPSSTQARDILARRLGASRIAAEPAAVDEIITRCARLPLALAVTAAGALDGRPLADVAAHLREAAEALDGFDSHDPATDLRAVLSYSYAGLSADAARLFRCLALHNGPDISVDAAASLIGAPVSIIRRHLSELVRAHLVTVTVAGRYSFHDLLRAYAMEQVNRHETQPDRAAARHRLLEHYLHTAHAAAMVIQPSRRAMVLDPPGPGVTVTGFSRPEPATAWFVAEETALGREIANAGWKLAWSVCPFLDSRGRWDDIIAIHETAAWIAERDDDQPGQTYAHRILATANSKLNRLAQAEHHNQRALALAETPRERAEAVLNLAYCAFQRGATDEALRHGRTALELFRAIGNRRGQAIAYNSIAFSSAHLGEPESALPHCRQALAAFEEIGDRVGWAITMDTLGFIHAARGDHRAAVQAYREAIAIFEAFDRPTDLAETLDRLSDAHEAMGDIDSAREARRQAAALFDRLGLPTLNRR